MMMDTQPNREENNEKAKIVKEYSYKDDMNRRFRGNMEDCKLNKL